MDDFNGKRCIRVAVGKSQEVRPTDAEVPVKVRDAQASSRPNAHDGFEASGSRQNASQFCTKLCAISRG